jgi:beta-galactosidase
MWNALAAGATGILFWQWRPELSGPESPGYGLTLPDGTPTARVDAVAEMAAAVAGEPLLAAGSTPEAPRAGLLLSRRAALLCYGNDRDMSTYAAAVMGAYRALHDADVAVAPLHEDTIRADGVPGSVKALYWPLPMAADSALARALTAFVARGGRLVAESSPGQHGWHGRYATIVPGAGLDELFGVRVAEADVEHRIAIRLPGGGHLAGAWLRDQLRIGAAEVDATFTDGAPAITRRAHGAGTAVLVGTYPSLGYHEQPTAEARRWFADVLGHDPEAAPLRWAEPAPGRFHRVHRAADGRRFAIAINATETAAQLEHDGGQVTRLEPQTGRVVPL